MEFLPAWVGPLGGTVAGIIAVGFATIKAFNIGWSSTEKAKDQAAKDLVTILQSTVETLKGEMKEMQANHLSNVSELGRLKGENETLMKILQGRDETYLKFQQEGFAAFKRISDNEADMKELLGLLRKALTPNT